MPFINKALYSADLYLIPLSKELAKHIAVETYRIEIYQQIFKYVDSVNDLSKF